LVVADINLRRTWGYVLSGERLGRPQKQGQDQNPRSYGRSQTFTPIKDMRE
jgi:hypothetical protein